MLGPEGVHMTEMFRYWSQRASIILSAHVTQAQAGCSTNTEKHYNWCAVVNRSLVYNASPGPRSESLASTKMCTTISHSLVPCTCSIQQLISIDGFTFAVMLALSVEVLCVSNCHTTGRVSLETLILATHAIRTAKADFKSAKIVGVALTNAVDVIGYLRFK